jgi:hypothetical protein
MSTPQQDTENVGAATQTPRYLRDEIFYFNDLMILVGALEIQLEFE